VTCQLADSFNCLRAH